MPFYLKQCPKIWNNENAWFHKSDRISLLIIPILPIGVFLQANVHTVVWALLNVGNHKRKIHVYDVPMKFAFMRGKCPFTIDNCDLSMHEQIKKNKGQTNKLGENSSAKPLA